MASLSLVHAFLFYITAQPHQLLMLLHFQLFQERERAKARKKERKKEITMIKLRSKRFSRSSSKLGSGNKAAQPAAEKDCRSISEIKWELRPGGMLVQKRESNQNAGEGMITIRVSTVSQWHDISIEATSTFAELKMVLSLVTSLEPREQRLLFRGKERDDNEFLHMVGVRDKDKVLLLEDPATKEKKLLGFEEANPLTILVPPSAFDSLVNQTHC